ncbi:MAG TPA: methyl-accepting chemotaxis protein, partial [Myxococcales bacterium]|nr:methyl-accepting chemotaxis protein [Myxococcales bacterium]
MRRPVRDEITTLNVRRDTVLPRLVRPVEERPGQLDLSLRSKILLGYMVLGAALSTVFMLTHGWPDLTRLGLAAAVTLVSAISLPTIIARVTRVRVLSRGALEISRGDLSKPVALTAQGWGKDEIDELALAISNMQENLRELVGHIQHTAQSVSDSATDFQRSSENVNASTE